MKIAITGATGFIGSHLAECLAARGHEVSCLVRDPARGQWLEGLAARLVRGDLDCPEALARLVAGQDVVVHSAGLTKARTLEEYVRVNVGGTERLLAATHAHAPRLHRFVYFSSQAAMGPSTESAPLTEDAPRNPVSNYGKSKSLAERSLQERAGSIPLTIIRPPVVYGPRERDLFSYFRMVNAGIEPFLGGRRVMSIVYVANLVHGIALAIERPLGGMRSYFFTDGEDQPWAGLLDTMARALGKKPLRIRVPFGARRGRGGNLERDRGPGREARPSQPRHRLRDAPSLQHPLRPAGPLRAGIPSAFHDGTGNRADREVVQGEQLAVAAAQGAGFVPLPPAQRERRLSIWTASPARRVNLCTSPPRAASAPSGPTTSALPETMPCPIVAGGRQAHERLQLLPAVGFPVRVAEHRRDAQAGK